MTRTRILQVEGYVNYVPSRIERAIEAALAKYKLGLSIADHYQDYYDGIVMGHTLFIRDVLFLPKPYQFVYERKIMLGQKRLRRESANSILLFNKLQTIADTHQNLVEKLKTPVNNIQKHLTFKNIQYDFIDIAITEDMNILLSFEGRESKLNDLCYDDSDELAIPFLERAFEQYTGKKYPYQFPLSYQESPTPSDQELPTKSLAKLFTAALVDALNIAKPKERGKLYRQSSIHFVNMIVDEFARTLRKSTK